MRKLVRRVRTKAVLRPVHAGMTDKLTSALAWSNGEARWLTSAGDDYQILLWDMYGDLDQPRASFLGPRGNVLSLAISSANTYLYCGGTDPGLYQYSLSSGFECRPATSTRWSDQRHHHSDTIRDISTHPSNDHLLLTCGEDRKILLHDVRTPQFPAGLISQRWETTGVRYHPRSENLFVSSDNNGGVYLHDARVAFGRDGPKGTVLQYSTRLAKAGYSSLANPEASSVVFDERGTRFVVTFLGHVPTLYSLDDPDPIATFSGACAPDGSEVPTTERSYANASTMKHGSFGGDHYAAGSDDFRGYIWKVPPTAYLLDRRRKMTEDEWSAGEGCSTGSIGYSLSRKEAPVVPREISTPSSRVGGHKSIVNTALFHPHLPILATAGIESHICLHRPFSASISVNDSESSNEYQLSFNTSWVEGYLPPRELPLSIPRRERHRLLLTMLDGRPLEDGGVRDAAIEDMRSIAMFDELLRQDGHSNPFVSRIYEEDSDEDSSEERTEG
ncbi:hypothetical protein FRB95_002493 [Tulasnella sp. JGI-2019a]|nr:hypothetical protein FRB95_002493 [Tulasnella sp. JGI-2019a]